MKIKLFICVAMIFIFSSNIFASDEVSFNSDVNHKISIRVSNGEVSYYVNGNNKRGISVDTERKVKIIVDDFNFDGKKDFSIAHIDDGMGAYYIYRVFLFSAKVNDFIEIYPSCGDEFINLNLDKKKKVIMSTYYQDNQPMQCITKPPKV